MNRSFFNILAPGALLCAGLATGNVYAHGGEDHDDPAPAVATAASSWLPRASATTEEFEIVAVLEAQPRRLMIYLDRAAGNDPVSKATLEVEGAGATTGAVELAPGVYEVSLQQPLAPGAHALNFTVQSSDGADLIAATLNVPAANIGVPATTRSRTARAALPAAWLSGSALLAVGGLAVMMLRRRRSASSSPTRPRETS